MKLKHIIISAMLILSVPVLSGCVPLVVGASAGAAGGYVYSKNYPPGSN
ncbi:MAG: hypothetical protein K0Q57_642 [Gammaproteobacteria bacterium]|jgi:hypothetical protein|nr:hypothetical protein [Gammaproteobacteria bacterium]